MGQVLKGKVAVITGGNSGIGFATAKRFVQEGAQVVITGRNQQALDQAVTELGDRALGVAGDVAKTQDLDHLYATVKDRFGAFDVLFANAGVAAFAPIEEVNQEHFDHIFDINVKGLFFTVQKALPVLKPGSSIVMNGSISGVKGIAGSSVYSATKAAVRSFARVWAAELKERKIRVNTLSPGPVETPIFSKLGLTETDLSQMSQAFASQVPLGRFGRPEEIAAAALFLASDEASFINGADLQADGGLAQI